MKRAANQGAEGDQRASAVLKFPSDLMHLAGALPESSASVGSHTPERQTVIGLVVAEHDLGGMMRQLKHVKTS